MVRPSVGRLHVARERRRVGLVRDRARRRDRHRPQPRPGPRRLVPRGVRRGRGRGRARRRHLDGAAFSVAATGSWTSPTTGATWPAGWRISIPGEGLEIGLQPTRAEPGARHAGDHRRRLLGGLADGDGDPGRAACRGRGVRGADRLRGRRSGPDVTAERVAGRLRGAVARRTARRAARVRRGTARAGGDARPATQRARTTIAAISQPHGAAPPSPRGACRSQRPGPRVGRRWRHPAPDLTFPRRLSGSPWHRRSLLGARRTRRGPLRRVCTASSRVSTPGLSGRPAGSPNAGAGARAANTRRANGRVPSDRSALPPRE